MVEELNKLLGILFVFFEVFPEYLMPLHFCFADPLISTEIAMNPPVRSKSNRTANMKNFLWPRQVVTSVKKE